MKFIYNEALKLHIGLDKAGMDLRKVTKCNLCGKFLSDKKLKQISKNTGRPHYICYHCGKDF